MMKRNKLDTINMINGKYFDPVTICSLSLETIDLIKVLQVRVSYCQYCIDCGLASMFIDFMEYIDDCQYLL